MTIADHLLRKEITMRRGELTTWGCLFTDATAEQVRAPLVICHGGPGLTHNYLESLAWLTAAGHTCVFYDQFGNGRSGRALNAPAEFWVPELFLDELRALIDLLGFDRFHLLGHSWGGSLALRFAVGRPAGLLSAVVASAFACGETYAREVATLLAELPAEAQEQIRLSEATGDYDSEEFGQALRTFYRRHVCRATPVPDEVLRSAAAIAQNPSVYLAMAGPSEFLLTGTLRTFDLRPQLRTIEVPVLLTAGRYDEVTPGTIDEIEAGLVTSERVLFEESSHMPHVEEPERYLAVVTDFLARAEASGRLGGQDRAERCSEV